MGAVTLKKKKKKKKLKKKKKRQKGEKETAGTRELGRKGRKISNDMRKINMERNETKITLGNKKKHQIKSKEELVRR